MPYPLAGKALFYYYSQNMSPLRKVADYEYDPYNRLTKADHYDIDDGVISSLNRYGTSYSYDKRGNITSLHRNGMTDENGCTTHSQIDNLNYTYPSNSDQLSDVHDISGNAEGFENGWGGNYNYDSNGNITLHKDRKLSITYNHLNLPTLIQNYGSQGGYLHFMYDAAGNLLQRKSSNTANGSSPIETIDYVAGIEYKNGHVSQIMHNEGYVQYTNGTNPEYHYTIQDHLGNTRLIYSDKNQNGKIESNTEIIQENHYYPFGLTMKGAWMGNENNYKYKYNGIEQVDNFGIDLNFAHYRTLDPTIGRWLQVDPKAEANIMYSPYNSMSNNPISNIDPMGDNPFVAAGIGFVASYAATAISLGIQRGNGGNDLSNGQIGAISLGAGLVGGAIGYGIGAGIESGFFSGGGGSSKWAPLTKDILRDVIGTKLYSELGAKFPNDERNQNRQFFSIVGKRLEDAGRSSLFHPFSEISINGRVADFTYPEFNLTGGILHANIGEITVEDNIGRSSTRKRDQLEDYIDYLSSIKRSIKSTPVLWIISPFTNVNNHIKEYATRAGVSLVYSSFEYNTRNQNRVRVGAPRVINGIYRVDQGYLRSIGRGSPTYRKGPGFSTKLNLYSQGIILIFNYNQMKFDNIILKNLLEMNSDSIHLDKIWKDEFDKYLEISKPTLIEDYENGFVSLYFEKDYQVYVVWDLELRRASLFKDKVEARTYHDEILGEYTTEKVFLDFLDYKKIFENKYGLQISNLDLINHLGNLVEIDPEKLDFSVSSVKHLDNLLTNTLFQENTKMEEFIFFIGFYITEVIDKNYDVEITYNNGLPTVILKKGNIMVCEKLYKYFTDSYLGVVPPSEIFSIKIK